MSPVTLSRRGRIAIVTIDNPPVNALSHAVRQGLADALAALAADAGLDGAVLACAGRTFVAGADVTEFGRPAEPPFLADLLDTVEAGSKPVCAALFGTTLGGGFELALACHYRAATPTAEIGLPEVKLGLIPGAGGTQRLPRLIGIAAAIDVATTGRRVKAAEAAALGIVDRVAEGDLVDAAVAFLEERIAAGGAFPVASARAVAAPTPAEAEALLAEVRRKARGVDAPVEAALSVLRAAALPFAEGLAAERDAFERLRASDQSKALRHVFFAEREAAKVPGLAGVQGRAVTTVGVVGGGLMGSGIAIAAADAGLGVTIAETDAEGVARAAARVAAHYADQAKKGRLTEAQAAERRDRIAVAVGVEALAHADLVIEAVFEDMGVKQDIFARLGRVAKPGAVLATNTSYLDVDAIADASGRPGDVLGLHFFAPANVMRLLEVVRAARTAPDALATGLALGKRLGKLSVVAGVCDGFIGNRIWSAWRRHLEYLVEDGATPEQIDAAIVAWGLPMGPFAVYDMSGLDIAWATRKRKAATRDPAERYVRIADRLCEAGRMGRKTGAGWYRYADGKAHPDPDVAAIVADERRQRGIVARPFTAEAIQRRSLAAIANEAARILAEGIAQRPSDIDMVMVAGYGFPNWRGGPLFEADRIGLPAVLAEVEAAAAVGGAGAEPSPLLVDLVRTGRAFRDLGTRG
jgi:3-hydroxyacyl-CoA dehydrogenase